MMTEHEWNIISQKAFPLKIKAVKAPPFLWTRIAALIQSEEVRRASVWWMQWRWMSRVTIAVGVLVSLGAFYLVDDHAQQQILQVTSLDAPLTEDSGVLDLEFDS